MNDVFQLKTSRSSASPDTNNDDDEIVRWRTKPKLNHVISLQFHFLNVINAIAYIRDAQWFFPQLICMFNLILQRH